MKLKATGLTLTAIVLATPLIWFPELAAKHDTIALFSQYLGIWALIAMAITQIIATRLTGIEAIFGGLDRSYILHKWLGIGALVAVLLHDTIDAEMNGLGAETVLTEVAETAGEISLYGLLILSVITVATFIPYHLWHWTHKFMGAFFALSAFHYLFILKPFSNGEPLGLYTGTFCLLGVLAYVYKLLPDRMRPSKTYTVDTVTKVEDTTSITLKPSGKPLNYKAGQFAFVTFESNGLSERHPFTISKAPSDDGNLRFTIATLGDYTYRLNKTVQSGLTAKVEGPFGRFINPAPKHPQIWIAAGIGITPFVAWANALPDDHAPVTLHYSVRHAAQAAHLDELQEQAKRLKNFTLHVHETHTGQRLTIEDIASNDLSKTKVFFCGPEAMRKSLVNGFKMRGLSSRSFHYEEFEIRSGIGLRRFANYLLKRTLG